jgi:hypothetical protein
VKCRQSKPGNTNTPTQNSMGVQRVRFHLNLMWPANTKKKKAFSSLRRAFPLHITNKRVVELVGVLPADVYSACLAALRAVLVLPHRLQPLTKDMLTLTVLAPTGEEQKWETYNRRDSQMVTHSSTSRPVQCLCMAERTGCPVLTDLWSYVCISPKRVNKYTLNFN